MISKPSTSALFGFVIAMATCIGRLEAADSPRFEKGILPVTVKMPGDDRPTITFKWPEPKSIARVELVFDTDYDHPMESVLMGHPEEVMPFCVRDIEVISGDGRVVAKIDGNHQSRRTLHFEPALSTETLTLRLNAPHASGPAALFEVRCYAE